MNPVRFKDCIDCKPPKRPPGCHDKCPSYQRDRKELNDLKNKIWEEKRKCKDMDDYKKSSVNKAIWKKERSKKK